MPMVSVRSTLNAIQDRDPDGGETEPTADDYARFERWAIEAYGVEAWAAYTRGGWADPADWSEGDHSEGYPEFVNVTGQQSLFSLSY